MGRMAAAGGRWRSLARPARADGAFPDASDHPLAGRSPRRDPARHQLRRARLGGRRGELDLVLRAAGEQLRAPLSDGSGAGAPAVRGRERQAGLLRRRRLRLAGRRAARSAPSSARTRSSIRPTARGCWPPASPPARGAPSTRSSNRRTAARRSAGRSIPGAPGDLVTGLEIAASDPMTIDLALSRGAAAAPTLARSIDGGATWQLADLTAALGGGQVRIVAIDPSDDDRVWLRALGAGGRRAGAGHQRRRDRRGAALLRQRRADSVRAHRHWDTAGGRDGGRRAGAVSVDRRRRDVRRAGRSAAHPGPGRARRNRLRRRPIRRTSRSPRRSRRTRG